MKIVIYSLSIKEGTAKFLDLLNLRRCTTVVVQISVIINYNYRRNNNNLQNEDNNYYLEHRTTNY